jgi:hypothetical protein
MIMRHTILRIWLVLTCVALALTACKRSRDSAEGDAPAEIRGEPINDAARPSLAVPSTAEIKPAPPVESMPALSIKPKTPEKTGELLSVGFDELASYNFEVPEETSVTNQTATIDKTDRQIPLTVKAFNQKKVSIKGFMLPLKVQDGSVTEFLIMKDQSMCCYGNVPKITEWISVKTTGKGVKAIMDQPVSIQGTLHVGAMLENGYLVGIYRMDGDKLVESTDNN